MQMLRIAVADRGEAQDFAISGGQFDGPRRFVASFHGAASPPLSSRWFVIQSRLAKA